LKLLDKYILREFLKFFFITFIFFIVLFLIVDFSKNQNVLSNHATIHQMIAYFIYSIPMIIFYILPPAVLLSTLMTFGSFSKNNEITAMKASGINIYRILRPVLIFGIVTAAFLFYFSELIVPASMQKTEQIIKIEVQKRKTPGFFQYSEIWYRSDHAIYNFKYFDVDKNMIKGATINYLTPDFTLKTRIDARKAEWENNQWVFSNVLEIHLEDASGPILKHFPKKSFPFLKT